MTIRVLLGATTVMVKSAFQGALSDCEDIVLIQTDPSEIAPDDVDVVILHRVALGDCTPALRVIADAARIGVVAIGDDGLAGNLYRVDRQGWRFTSGGKHGLADAVRTVARAS